MKRPMLLLLCTFAITSLAQASESSSPVSEGDTWDQITACNENSPNYMLSGTSMKQAGCLISRNGIYWLRVRRLNSIGIEIHNAPGTGIQATPAWVSYWSSGDKAPSSLETTLDLNPSGTLAVYDKGIAKGGTVQWSSGTGGTHADTLIITDWGELILQRGSPWATGDNPTLNPNGRYKKRYVAVNRDRFIKGFAGVHTPTVGMHILEYDFKHAVTKTKNADLTGASSAHDTAANCGVGARTNFTGSRSLGGSVSETRTWGTSKTIGTTREIAVEVGQELESAVAKTKWSVGVKRALSETTTTSRERSRTEEKHYSVTMNYDVPPGHYQTFSMVVQEQTIEVPYTALAIVQPTGHGRWVTRYQFQDTFTDTSGQGATLNAGDLVPCKSSD